MRTKRGAHFVPRSSWAARKSAQAVRVERVQAGTKLHRGHDLIAHDRVGHGVDGGEDHVGMALQDALDRRRPRSSRRPRAASRGRARRSRRSRPRPGRPGRPSSTSPRAAGPARRRRCASSPRSPAPPALETSSPIASSALSSRPCSSKRAGGHSSPVAGSSTTVPSGARPSAPGGVSGVRCTVAPPSVDPYESVTATPKRSAKRATSSGDPSLPKARTSGLSASSGCSGVARMYDSGLPDVVEVGRTGRPHVGQEARGGEAARRGEGERRARHQRRPPAGHQRVGVEERHGEVAHVVGGRARTSGPRWRRCGPGGPGCTGTPWARPRCPR